MRTGALSGVNVELPGLEYRHLALEVRQRVVIHLCQVQHVGTQVGPAGGSA
jgi:hypothetical protein